MLLFVDCEGDPVQELSGILVAAKNFAIVDVFHAHANDKRDDDTWSRKNVHGLCLNFLQSCAFPSECELACAFHVWYSKRKIDYVFANAPKREADYLNLNIFNLPLPTWKDRPNDAAHQLALSCKINETPIGHQACTKDIHNAFHPSKPQPNASVGVCARFDFGHHCSLYDAYEIYLFMLLHKK